MSKVKSKSKIMTMMSAALKMGTMEKDDEITLQLDEWNYTDISAN